ncbi:phage minor head protein [Halopseudomonas sp. SMJS2]|uniref:phage minor head protein n=1 Tax=Halopseudomonas sp. SMJS2 TaxID=3041098 RepID=UPI00245365B4|nr:phage minor head protein [Halopseudomonas sp. SMJS2]WGK60518.1 phage minor head protein [Halopseudomonas sp. SMJS2]
MATANDRLADLAIGHQIYLQRYGGGVARKIISLLNRVDADLYRQLGDALERLPPERFTVQRLDQLLVGVQRLNADAYRAVGEELDTALLELAGYEASWQHRAISSVLPSVVAEQLTLNTVTASQAHAAAMARPFQGKLLREALAGIEQARAFRIRDTIRMGFVEGQTIDQMVRRLRGTRALGYADGLMEVDRRGAEALVRTAVNHTANYARQALYEGNADIVEEWEFVATLDGRTTLTCAGLSGKTFKIGTGPQPPRHWGCRSASVPVLKSAWEALGLSKSEIDPGVRASMDGEVAGDISYGPWLKSKPAAFQDEVLGPERGKLFREGGLTVDRFTDQRGKVYTLDELRKRDADAFEKAGILAA